MLAVQQQTKNCYFLISVKFWQVTFSLVNQLLVQESSDRRRKFEATPQVRIRDLNFIHQFDVGWVTRRTFGPSKICTTYPKYSIP